MSKTHHVSYVTASLMADAHNWGGTKENDERSAFKATANNNTPGIDTGSLLRIANALEKIEHWLDPDKKREMLKAREKSRAQTEKLEKQQAYREEVFCQWKDKWRARCMAIDGKLARRYACGIRHAGAEEMAFWRESDPATVNLEEHRLCGFGPKVICLWKEAQTRFLQNINPTTSVRGG